MSARQSNTVPGVSVPLDLPYAEIDYSAWDAPGAYDPRPDLLAEEHRLNRRHEVVMSCLDIAKDLGAGTFLGLLLGVSLLEVVLRALA